MKKKIIGFFVCMLMVATVLTATGAMNFQTTELVNENNYNEPYLSAQANPGYTTIKIVAKVYDIDDQYNILGGAIKVNDTITGKYTYDFGIPDSNPNDTIKGEYYFMSSSCGIELKSGGLVFKTNPNDINFHIFITNNHVILDDSYIVYSGNNLQLSNGLLVDDIIWTLIDDSGTAFSSDALLTTAPVLEDFDYHILSINGKNPSNPSQSYIIWANVTKATKSNSARDLTFNEYPILIWLLERFQNIFPILRHLINQ